MMIQKKTNKLDRHPHMCTLCSPTHVNKARGSGREVGRSWADAVSRAGLSSCECCFIILHMVKHQMFNLCMLLCYLAVDYPPWWSTVVLRCRGLMIFHRKKTKHCFSIELIHLHSSQSDGFQVIFKSLVLNTVKIQHCVFFAGRL